MSITGNLETMELTGLLQWVEQGRKTGTLVIKNTRDEKRLIFENGALVSVFSTIPHEHICRFLLDRELVDKERLKAALKENRGNSLQLGRALVEAGQLDRGVLIDVLEVRAEEMIRDLLDWPAGDFHFVDGERPSALPVSFSLDITALLLRVANRIDRMATEAATGPVSIERGREPISRGQLALVPDLDPLTDEIPVSAPPMEAVPAEPEEQEVGPAETAVASAAYATPAMAASPWRWVAAAATVLALAAIVVGFLMRRGEEPLKAGTVTAGTVASTENAATEIEQANASVEANREVIALEARLATLQEQMDVLLEEKAEAVESSLRAEYERELAVLQGELQTARAARLDAASVAQSAQEPAAISASGSDPAIDSLSDTGSDSSIAVGEAAEATSDVSEISESDVSEISEALFSSDSLSDETPSGESSWRALEEIDNAASVTPAATPAPVTEVVTSEASTVGVEAATPPGDVAARGTAGPRMVRSPRAKYPPLARKMGREASIEVEVLVGTNGRALEARTVGGEVGLGFESAALAAARGARWEPAQVDGEPAEAWTSIRIDFRIDG